MVKITSSSPSKWPSFSIRNVLGLTDTETGNSTDRVDDVTSDGCARLTEADRQNYIGTASGETENGRIILDCRNHK